MSQRFLHPGAALGLLLLALLSIAPGADSALAQDAKPPKETPAEAKRRIIKERRPSESEVKAAREAITALDPSFLRFANTLRALAHANPKFKLETRYQDDLPVPELGSLPANADEEPDTWVLMRLLALVRSGYPAEPRLLAELENVLNSRATYSGQSWAEASLELLFVDAIVCRRETGLAAYTERALTRGRAVAASRKFEVSTYDRSEMTNTLMVELMHMALCRSFVRKHGLLSALPDSNWKLVMQRAYQLAIEQYTPDDIPRWESNDTKPTWTDRSRSALELAALLYFASDEEVAGIDSRQREQLIEKLSGRLPPSFAHKHAWRAFRGDAAFLFMSLRPLRETETGKALQANLAESLLTTQRLPFMRPRLESSHVATALGWTLAPGPEEEGMGRRHLNLQQRDHLGTLCLALLAASGGLLGDLAPEEPLPMEQLSVAFNALDVLDLEDFYFNMLRTDNAIENGAQWLFKQQNADGTFVGLYSDGLGGHALNVLMLLEAGVDRDFPEMRKAMSKMRELGPTEKDGDWFAGTNVVSFGAHATYSMALMQMAYAKYYEKEEIEAGIFKARTRDEFLVAQRRMWAKLPKSDRTTIGHIAWAVSNNDGYGWGYGIRQPKNDPPVQTESPPDPKDPAGPITGEKGSRKKEEGEAAPAGEKIADGRFPPRPKVRQWTNHCDNSNSQYAVLGLKAALLLGAPLKLEALAWEAERLVENFTVLGQAERVYVTPDAATIEPPKVKRDSRYADPDAAKRVRRKRAWLQKYDVGAWAYQAGKGSNTFGTSNNEQGEGGPRADDYDNIVRTYRLAIGMSAAGISSLSILRDALMLAQFRDKELLTRMETAIAGGLFMLGLKYPYSRTITSIDNARNSDAWWRGADGGPGMMYDMYSCERAGVLTGSRYFANIDWYRDGADLLIDKQDADGHWPDLHVTVQKKDYPQVVSHCFAILFLKRCAPPLSQEPPEDRRVYTGEKKEKPAEAEPRPPEPGSK